MLAQLLPLLAEVSVSPTSTVEVELQGLRNGRGVIQACLTHDATRFPSCAGETRAIRQTEKVGSGTLTFRGLPPGTYALILFHDENANKRLDTFLGIPKEGFGFSRNPVVRFGAPRYDQVAIELSPGLTRLRVRLQYLL